MTPCDTLQVSEAELDQSKSWTEAEYLALGEKNSRIELIDGGLWMSPYANNPHQRIFGFLFKKLEPAAEAADLLTLASSNVRLGADRIVIPDLVVADSGNLALVNDAADVVLVAEITSPSNAAYDRVFKKHLYAAANIEWYLLVEPDMTTYETVELRLFRLAGHEYAEYALAKNGETLSSTRPFNIEIDTQDLIRYVLTPGRRRI